MIEILVEKEGASLIKVSVCDRGIGVPAHEQHKLFQRFSQVDSSTARKYGGTGLGLAISKNLMELMGGGVGYRSREGGGSIFWFAIPTDQSKN